MDFRAFGCCCFWFRGFYVVYAAEDAIEEHSYDQEVADNKRYRCLFQVRQVNKKLSTNVCVNQGAEGTHLNASHHQSEHHLAGPNFDGTVPKHSKDHSREEGENAAGERSQDHASLVNRQLDAPQHKKRGEAEYRICKDIGYLISVSLDDRSFY